MDPARGVVCEGCGGPVVVADESTHPCGVYIQHGRCADCGALLWRLLDEQRIPVTDSRGRWTTAAGGAKHPTPRLPRPAERETRRAGGSRPARRTDRTRPGN